MVKNLPAMHKTQVRSLGQEDPLEKGMATDSSIFAWKNLMDRGACHFIYGLYSLVPITTL